MTTIDPRLRQTTSATVSVAVSPDELAALKAAARLSSMSVSAWGAARVAAALMSPENRARAKAAVGKVAKVDRAARASVIFQADAHADLKRQATELDVTAHDLVQATLLTAARGETARLAPDTLAAAASAPTRRTRAAAAPPVTAMVPGGLLELDPAALSHVVTQLLDAALSKVFEGKGPTIQSGMQTMIAKLPADKLGPFPLAVDPVAVEAVARVLRVDRDVMLTALAIKGASTL